MPHPFEISLGDVANRRGVPFRNKYRLLGWETVDIKALSQVIEVSQDYLKKLLSGKLRPVMTEAVIERNRVVALVGVALRLGADEVEKRIERTRALRGIR